MDNKINITAPIIPGVGAAGMEILENAYKIIEQAFNNVRSFIPTEKKLGDWEHYSLFPGSVVYSYKEIVDFYIDVCSGLIITISISPGYLGTLWDKLKIGDQLSKLLDVRSDVSFDEDKIILENERNIFFELDYDSDINSLEDVKDKVICKIWLENSTFNSHISNFYRRNFNAEVWKSSAIKALNDL